MHYVYLLKLRNGNIYVGSTPNLKERIIEHEKGFAKSTRIFRPLKLIWYSAFEEKLAALRFERYMKTGSGQAFRNKHLI